MDTPLALPAHSPETWLRVRLNATRSITRWSGRPRGPTEPVTRSSSSPVYAPTNLLVRCLSAEESRWRIAAVLAVVGASLLMAMHAASAVVNGAPWLNFLVLVLARDAIKFELAAGFRGSCLWSARRAP